MYVNSADGSIYIGDGENAPIKLITELNIGDYETGGGDEPSTNPEWPALKDLIVGNNITWANQEWIVAHVTKTEVYLTLKGLTGGTPPFGGLKWTALQSSCTNFANNFTEAQKACLKSVRAGNTTGIVFVATRDQMSGDFSYFNSDSRRRVEGVLNNSYWTSTDYASYGAWLVSGDGSVNSLDDRNTSSLGFRPSVCIDLTLYV